MVLRPGQSFEDLLRRANGSCPRCGGLLRRWGQARWRVVRDAGAANRRFRPRRVRCARCRVTQVVLPPEVLLRRRDSVAVVGEAWRCFAGGAGSRRVARLLGVPVETVRGWLRRLRLSPTPGTRALFGAAGGTARDQLGWTLTSSSPSPAPPGASSRPLAGCRLPLARPAALQHQLALGAPRPRRCRRWVSRAPGALAELPGYEEVSDERQEAFGSGVVLRCGFDARAVATQESAWRQPVRTGMHLVASRPRPGAAGWRRSRPARASRRASPVALASFVEHRSGLRIELHHPLESPGRWIDYLDGAESRYRAHGVESALDRPRLEDGRSTSLFFVAIDDDDRVVGGIRCHGPLRAAVGGLRPSGARGPSPAAGRARHPRRLRAVRTGRDQRRVGRRRDPPAWD